jgi:hypothetical protein
MMMVTILMDLILNNFNNSLPSLVGLFPITMLRFVVNDSTDLLNFVPVSFTLLHDGAGSLDVVHLVLELLREVLGAVLEFISDTGVKALEDFFHAFFGFLALRWVWWLWVLAAVASGVLDDFGHSVKAFFGTVPVTVHGLVKHVLSNVSDVGDVRSAHTSEVTGRLHIWDLLNHVFEFSLGRVSLVSSDRCVKLSEIDLKIE